MKLISEHLVKGREEMTEEQRTAKEKEGIFSMEAEQAQIDAMMAQIHGPPTATPAGIQPIKADKNRNKRRK